MEIMSEYLGPQKEIITPNKLSKYDNGQWLAEEKHDGCWALLKTNERGIIRSITARSNNPIIDPNIIGSNFGFANTELIGEIEYITPAACRRVLKRGYARFWAFDILKLLDHSIKNVPIEQRRTLLVRTLASLKGSLRKRVIPVQQVVSDFDNFYRTIKSNGGEGIVLKRVGSLYKSSCHNNRTSNWIRVKDIHTVELIVIGKGKTPSQGDKLLLGTWNNGNPKYVQSMSLPRGFMARELFGKVIECMYDFKLDSGTYRHLRFLRTRPDKTKEMCI